MFGFFVGTFIFKAVRPESNKPAAIDRQIYGIQECDESNTEFALNSNVILDVKRDEKHNNADQQQPCVDQYEPVNTINTTDTTSETVDQQNSSDPLDTFDDLSDHYDLLPPVQIAPQNIIDAYRDSRYTQLEHGDSRHARSKSLSHMKKTNAILIAGSTAHHE